MLRKNMWYLLLAVLLITSMVPLTVTAQTEVDESLTGTIVISMLGDNPPEEAMDALLGAYKEIRPNVEVIWENAGVGAAEYPAWLGTQLAVDDIRPDIVSGNYFSNYQGYVNLDAVRFLTNPHTDRMWAEDLDWDFYRGQNTFGERIMVPTRAVHINFFYNVNVFEEVGVEPPTTWSEFVAACEAIEAAKPDMACISANYQWQVPQWLIRTHFDLFHIDWLETVRAQPGDWNYNSDLDGTFEFDPSDPFIHNRYTYSRQRYYAAVRDGVLRYDTPEVAEMVRVAGALFPKHAVSDFFVISDPYPRFIAQQAAIMYNGTWAMPSLVRDMDDMTDERLEELGLDPDTFEAFQWDTFEMPNVDSDLAQIPSKTVESATGEYVSIIEKDQAQTDLVIDFVMFWLSEAGYGAYNEARIANGGGASGPLRVNNVQDPPEITQLFDRIEFLGNAEVSFPTEFLQWGGGDIRTEARDIWKQGLEGTITPEETAAQLQALVENNFDAILEQIGLTHEDLDNPSRQPGT